MAMADVSLPTPAIGNLTSPTESGEPALREASPLASDSSDPSAAPSLLPPSLHAPSARPKAPSAPRNPAACINCRKAKVRCDITADSGNRACTRCSKTGRDCALPDPTTRRRRLPAVTQLRREGRASSSSPTLSSPSVGHSAIASPLAAVPTVGPNAGSSVVENYKPPLSPHSSRVHLGARDARTDVFHSPPTVDRLLINASYGSTAHLSRGPPSPPALLQPRHSSPITHAHVPDYTPPLEANAIGLRASRSGLIDGFNSTSSPTQFSLRRSCLSRRDVGPTLDPIDTGLLEEGDVHSLFAFYYKNLNPPLPVLDQDLHTVDYVRSASSLLLTAICLASAQAMPNLGALAKRLTVHMIRLREEIVFAHLCSIELVLAFTVLATWMPAFDESKETLWLGIAMAMTRELGLDRDFEERLQGRPRRCTATDAPSSVDPDLYLRAAERVFLAIYLWDRTTALMTGQSWGFGDGRIAATLERWPEEPYKRQGDVVLVDIVSLALQRCYIRETVDGHLAGNPSLSVSQLILGLVRTSIDSWMPRSRSGQLPYRQETLLALYQGQAQLWALALGLARAGSADLDLSVACWRAAIGCSEAIVMHADALRHLPATSLLSVAHAALLALHLAPTDDATMPFAATLGIISQVARVLQYGPGPPTPLQPISATYGYRLNQLLQAFSEQEGHLHNRLAEAQLWPPQRAVMTMQLAVFGDGSDIGPTPLDDDEQDEEKDPSPVDSSVRSTIAHPPYKSLKSAAPASSSLSVTSANGVHAPTPVVDAL